MMGMSNGVMMTGMSNGVMMRDDYGVNDADRIVGVKSGGGGKEGGDHMKMAVGNAKNVLFNFYYYFIKCQRIKTVKRVFRRDIIKFYYRHNNCE